MRLTDLRLCRNLRSFKRAGGKIVRACAYNSFEADISYSKATRSTILLLGLRPQTAQNFTHFSKRK